MKNLLIVPRYEFTEEENPIYQFPIGLGYISSVIKKAGFHLDCINLNAINGKLDEILFNALKKEYDYILTGGMARDFLIIQGIIEAIRKYTNSKVILGGPIITSERELMFNELKPDYAIIGEGEETIVDLLEHLESNKEMEEVLGIMYNKEEKTVFTGERKPIEDLDELPFPDMEGLNFNHQLGKMGYPLSVPEFKEYREYPMITGRGCPYQCTFCYQPLGRKYRFRSLNNVFKEIKMAVKKYKVNFFWFYDDSFAISRERILDFCGRMKKIRESVDYKVIWMCQLNVHQRDKELLREMKDAGCFTISWGFESYSPAILKSMKKPIFPYEIDEAIKNCMEVGISLQGGFLFGDVAETKETYRETLEYWKNNCKGQVRLNFIQPYPESEIWKHCISRGIIKDKLKHIKENIRYTVYLNMTEKMSDKEYNKMKRDVFKMRSFWNYVAPISIEENKVTTSCPFCNEHLAYYEKVNPRYFQILCLCDKCGKIFFTASLLRRLEIKNYGLLDFLRRLYLRKKNMPEVIIREKEDLRI